MLVHCFVGLEGLGIDRLFLIAHLVELPQLSVFKLKYLLLKILCEGQLLVLLGYLLFLLLLAQHQDTFLEDATIHLIL